MQRIAALATDLLAPEIFAPEIFAIEKAVRAEIPQAQHIDLELAHPKIVPEDAEEILKEDLLADG